MATGLTKRMPPGRQRDPVGDQIGGERRGQPEERRRLQIDPEPERDHVSLLRPISRLTKRKTPTVASRVRTVETISAAASAAPCA